MTLHKQSVSQFLEPITLSFKLFPINKVNKVKFKMTFVGLFQSVILFFSFLFYDEPNQ